MQLFRSHEKEKLVNKAEMRNETERLQDSFNRTLVIQPHNEYASVIYVNIVAQLDSETITTLF